MLQYLRLFESLRVNFHDVHIVKVPRSQNSHVDSLATLASSLGDHIPPNDTSRAFGAPEHWTPNVSASCDRTGVKLDGSVCSLFVRQVFAKGCKRGKEGVEDVGTFLAIWGKEVIPTVIQWTIFAMPLSWETIKLLTKLHEGVYGGHSGGGSLCTKPWLRDFGGQICNRKRQIILENVIGARFTHHYCISQVETSTRSPALGSLPNEG